MMLFYAESTKNTFVLCDRINCNNLDDIEFDQIHKVLLDGERDDALILFNGLLRPDSFAVSFLVLGRDGAFGEFCGNGARACAAYLYSHYSAYERFTLTTAGGEFPLSKVGENMYAVQLPYPSFVWNKKFVVDPLRCQEEYPHLVYVEAVEPHLTFYGEMGDAELLDLGRVVNEKKELFPLGINVNVWKKTGDQSLFVKTYERGVQRLTQSCGTGSISCVALAGMKGYVAVATPGGILQIHSGESYMKLIGESKI